jgi:hypothetical protein
MIFCSVISQQDSTERLLSCPIGLKSLLAVQYKLADLLTEKGAMLGWLYDLGDCWKHEIEDEEIRR